MINNLLMSINKYLFAATLNSPAVTAADKLQFKNVPVLWLTLHNRGFLLNRKFVDKIAYFMVNF